MSYFIIKNYEDGPSFSGPYSKEQLEKEIQEAIDDGANYKYENMSGTRYFEDFPRRTAYIIKGEAVVPQSKKVVVETELP